MRDQIAYLDLDNKDLRETTEKLTKEIKSGQQTISDMSTKITNLESHLNLSKTSYIDISDKLQCSKTLIDGLICRIRNFADTLSRLKIDTHLINDEINKQGVEVHHAYGEDRGTGWDCAGDMTPKPKWDRLLDDELVKSFGFAGKPNFLKEDFRKNKTTEEI